MPMYDTDEIIKAGITPPDKIVKYSNSFNQKGEQVYPNLLPKNLDYDSLFYIMRKQNQVETLERYQWINVPFGLTADLIERVLFYKGKGVFYFNDKVGKFQFLPFALNGLIDEYGRYLRVNSLPFTGVTQTEESSTKREYDAYGNGKKKKSKSETSLIYENLDVVYDLPYNYEMLKDIADKKVVGIILNDNSLELSQQPIIRSLYVRPVLHLQATLMQIINTAMFGASDHNLVQVDSEAEIASINQQIEGINQDILRGKRYTAVAGKMPITPLRSSNTADLEGLFGTFNSLTNFLKSITGIANAGVFDKKAHLLQEEQKLNGSNSDDIYYNGLRLRQEFCLLVQAYYGYPVWCSSKRAMSEVEKENYLMGEKSDPDNTVQNKNSIGGQYGENGSQY